MKFSLHIICFFLFLGAVVQGVGQSTEEASCVPYYDETGAFSEALFQDALILDVNLDNVEEEKKKSAWIVFLMGLGGGLIALLTPCVFPMIPLTVSFFTKSTQNKGKGLFHAALYGFFIFLIYVLISVPFHLLNLAPDVLNEISTNVWLNIFFFVVFVFFAISFFGYYDISLPSGFANKVSSAENVGGIIGIFFMALTLAVVSFSCTGPIVGSLLAGTLSQGAWNLTAGMAGFGVALGLPFALFAMFPGMMNSLPKSGGWLTAVKVNLGFLELALALKFLSNADLVDPSLILIKREVFFAIWILILLGMVLHTLGILRFPHDTPLKKIKIPRAIYALSLAVVAALMVPSLWNNDVKIVRKVFSGFPPPMQYSLFNKNVHLLVTGVSEEDKERFHFAEKCPYDVPCFHDYFEARCYAKEKNRPILIDFTGYACVNCRRMEENVWPEENILELLANDVVLVSLYVDEKDLLPEEQQITVSHRGFSKALKTVGNKWSFLQIVNFEASTQPLYVMISPDEDILMNPIGYTPDPKQYKSLLLSGIEAHLNP